MSERSIPTIVVCCSCGGEFRPRTSSVRREVVAWVLAGKGGSLSGPRGQHFTGRWACNRCLGLAGDLLEQTPDTGRVQSRPPAKPESKTRKKKAEIEAELAVMRKELTDVQGLVVQQRAEIEALHAMVRKSA